MSQRDLRLSQQLALLNDASHIRSYLVLAANAATRRVAAKVWRALCPRTPERRHFDQGG
ncbi:MAG: hypothetical protein MZW92_26750 [Comamonadaceae bacterium]|nr:hypothetical protein [Comamonadaceae bacterium]